MRNSWNTNELMKATALLKYTGAALAGAIISLLLYPVLAPDPAPDRDLRPTTASASPVEQLPAAASQPTTGDGPEDSDPGLQEQEIQWLQQIIEQLQQENEDLHQKLLAQEVNRHPARPAANTQWFDESALLEAGLEERDFADLKQRVETLELQKLGLQNQATREGWLNSKDFYKQFRDLDMRFKQSLSPTDYDIYLYATGQPNRVKVSDVLGNSAAGAAGIRNGDIVLGYAGERIFNQATLYRLTTQGQPGEMVAITLLRGDETVISYVPRGPLGTRFQFTREPPIAP